MSTDLVTLSPPDTLVFKLDRNVESKETLKITNTSSEKLIFKVKTTQPTWYYVRPSQQVLDAGQTENISIVLVQAEALLFLDLPESEKSEKFEKHRFLVQTKPITEEEYQHISTLPSNERSDEFTKLWANATDQRKNLKLKVDFSYTSKAVVNDQPPPRVVDAVKNKIPKSDVLSSSGVVSGDKSSNESVVAELLNLRKKYDAVVDYTVHLTAERDTLVAQLEEVQKELNREKLKKKSDGSVPVKEVEVKKQGYESFIPLFVAVLLSFLLGLYLKLKITEF